MRQEEVRSSPNAGPWSGIRVVFTRKGLEVFGWYDHFVGVDDTLVLSWDEVEAACAAVNAKAVTP